MAFRIEVTDWSGNIKGLEQDRDAQNENLK